MLHLVRVCIIYSRILLGFKGNQYAITILFPIILGQSLQLNVIQKTNLRFGNNFFGLFKCLNLTQYISCEYLKYSKTSNFVLEQTQLKHK